MRLRKECLDILEAIAIPVLTKAIDFLFDEGHKILEEFRERRKSQPHQEARSSSIQSSGSAIQPFKAPDETPKETIRTKEDGLRQQVDQAVWAAHEAEVQHLLSLIDIYSKNYRQAKEAYAKWGSELVPSIILHRLQEAENALTNTMAKLRVVLQRVYGKAISIPELDELDER